MRLQRRFERPAGVGAGVLSAAHLDEAPCHLKVEVVASAKFLLHVRNDSAFQLLLQLCDLVCIVSRGIHLLHDYA